MFALRAVRALFVTEKTIEGRLARTFAKSASAPGVRHSPFDLALPGLEYHFETVCPRAFREREQAAGLEAEAHQEIAVFA